MSLFHPNEPQDLLSQYAEERKAAVRLRRFLAITSGLVLLFTSVLEYTINKTSWILTTTFIGMGVLCLAGFALGYAAFVYIISSHYAHWTISKGRTRPSALHLGSILAFCAVAAVIVGSSGIRENIDERFWIVTGFIVWTNVVAAFLGYLAPFIQRTIQR